MYIIAVIVDMVEKLDALKYLSFFKYYDAKDILKGSYSPVYPIVSVVIVGVLLFGTYYFYQRRDMKI
jgi:ABC-2 type transport system permease protein